MKFLCPSCKAKYKIAQEKVAGKKSARMKCRKCGHIIDIHAAAAAGDAEEEPGSTSPTAPVSPRAPARPPRAVPAPRAVPRAAPAPAPVAPALADAGDEDDSATVVRDVSVLAGLFQESVGASFGAAAPPPPTETHDEWYVGVGNTPLGPMPGSEIADLARSRKVSGDSLVWRDGFEDWQPLREFPELMSLLDDIDVAPVIPVPAAGIIGGDAVDRVQDDRESDLPPIVPPRAAMPPAAWLAIVAALGLGFTIAFVFAGGETKIIREVVSAPSAAKPAEVVSASPLAVKAAQPGADAGSGAPEPGSETATGPQRARNTVVKATGTADPKQTTETGKKLGGLSGLSAIGPNAGPGAQKATSVSSGQPLDATAVQGTVRRYSPSVRRSCWQPALNSRARDAPSTARVSVTINVAPSGSVMNVTTTGDPKGYMGLARCIDGKVRSWRFPPSSGSTTARVPFVFAAQ